MFNLLACIFIMGPSFLGISFYNKLTSKKDNTKKFDITKYFAYVFISNFIFLITMWLFNRPNENIYTKICDFSNYALIYAGLLIIINIVIGFIEFILEKYCEVTVEEKNEKSTKKNTKNN